MDGRLLKAKIVIKGMKIEEFLTKANEYGKLDRSKYYRVLRWEDEFDRSEILTISKTLDLSDNEMLDIFFKQEVS